MLPTGADVGAADIFNAAVAAAAVGAAWDWGALDELRERGTLVVDDFADRHRLDARATEAVLTSLAAVGVVRREAGAFLPGHNFADVFDAKGLFHWLVRGNADLFAKAGDVARLGNRSTPLYTRDGAAISTACRDINLTFFDPVFDAIMDRTDFTAVADLGCGSGERLVRVLRSAPGAHGIGIDLAEDALAVAAATVEANGLQDRVTLSKADARTLEPDEAYRSVDLVTCFLMGHDFWPREDCVDALRRLRAAFPGVRKLLIGDTAKSVGLTDDRVPIFTLGFETAHALMDVYLPTLEEWRGVFADGGWRCVAEHEVPVPASSVIFELEPA